MWASLQFNQPKPTQTKETQTFSRAQSALAAVIAARFIPPTRPRLARFSSAKPVPTPA